METRKQVEKEIKILINQASYFSLINIRTLLKAFVNQDIENREMLILQGVETEKPYIKELINKGLSKQKISDITGYSLDDLEMYFKDIFKSLE